MRRYRGTSGAQGQGWARWGVLGITEIPDYADPTKVYLKRWRLIESPWFGIKVHHIRMSDAPQIRGLHDHPWSFISIRLRRGYSELVPGPFFNSPGAEPCEAGPGRAFGLYDRRDHRLVNIVRSSDLHAVQLDDEERGCWTLVFNGRRKREWGFQFPGRQWMPWHQLDGPHARNIRGHAGSTEDSVNAPVGEL